MTGADHSYQTDESYSYDANGNRTNTGYTTGTNNRLTSDGTYNYTYDAEGNRTKKTDIASGDYVTYTWDHRNRLTDVKFFDDLDALQKHVKYTYDVDNRLIRKEVDDNGNATFDRAQKFVYDGSQIVLVFDDSDDLEHRFLIGPMVDQIFADENATNDVLWALADNLGTIRDVAEYDSGLDETTVVNHVKYNSFGNITAQSNSSAQPLFAYTGLMFDDDSELQYSRARWYDPVVGRFISEDPLAFMAGDSNVNRYVSNDPTNRTDPYGLKDGHHWIPQSVIDKLIESGLITKDQKDWFMKFTKIPDSYNHGFDTWWVGGDKFTHAGYNDSVYDLIKSIISDAKAKQLTNEQAVELMKAFSKGDFSRYTRIASDKVRYIENWRTGFLKSITWSDLIQKQFDYLKPDEIKQLTQAWMGDPDVEKRLPKKLRKCFDVLNGADKGMMRSAYRSARSGILKKLFVGYGIGFVFLTKDAYAGASGNGVHPHMTGLQGAAHNASYEFMMGSVVEGAYNDAFEFTGMTLAPNSLSESRRAVLHGVQPSDIKTPLFDSRGYPPGR